MSLISLDTIQAEFHSIEIKDASGQALTIDGSGFITSNINGTVTVDAADLDIRDLTSASDSVEVKTAAGQALDIDASGFLTANINGVVSIDDNGGSLTVDAADLDIRDLAFATDSVTSYQGGTWTMVLDAISSWKNSTESVTNAAAELVAAPLANRTKMSIQNLSSQDVYIGPDGTVTTVNGKKIPKGSSFSEKFSADVDVFAIAPTAGPHSILVTEFAD